MEINKSPPTLHRRNKIVGLTTIPEERHVRFLIPARDIFGGVLPPRRVSPSIPFISRKCQLMLLACPGSGKTDRVTMDVEEALWHRYQHRHIRRGPRMDNLQTMDGKSSLVIVKIPNKRSIFVSKVKRTAKALFRKTSLSPKSLARFTMKPRPRRQDPRRVARGRLLGPDAVKFTRSPSPFPRCDSCFRRSPNKSANKALEKPSVKLTKLPAKPTKSSNKDPTVNHGGKQGDRVWWAYPGGNGRL